MSNIYLIIKSLHIIADIAWMAGMLYLPRLFVYHANSTIGSTQSDTFKIMERRLLNAIMLPAAVTSWLTGLFLALQAGFFQSNWFISKFIVVILMSAIHVLLARFSKLFAEDRNTHPALFYRLINEVPTLLMIAIVFLVVVKPF